MIRYGSLDAVGDVGCYRADTDGAVWSHKGIGWKKLKPAPVDKEGHLSVVLRVSGVSRSYLVHHLVLFAFVGPRPNGMECRHLNGIPNDNRLENLCWGTPKENNADKKRHGTHLIGEDTNYSKLTEDKIISICNLWLTGDFFLEEIGTMFNVSGGNIAAIVSGKTWRHITEPMNFIYRRPTTKGGWRRRPKEMVS